MKAVYNSYITMSSAFLPLARFFHTFRGRGRGEGDVEFSTAGTAEEMMDSDPGKRIGFIRVVDKLSGWAGGAATFALFLITLTVICDAFARTLFNLPLRFGPDLLSLLAIYSILLPSAMALRNNRHIDVNLVFDRLPARMRRVIKLITFSIALSVFGITAFYGLDLFANSFKRGLKSNSPFGMKLWYSQLGVFIAMTLLCLQIIAKLIREVVDSEFKGEK